MISKICIEGKLGLFSAHWSPKVVTELNGQHVKLVKFQGDFVWHSHEQEDEMFLVVKGRFRMDFRDGSLWIEEGDMIVIPRGMEHKPYSDEEVAVMLFEPASTVNTGGSGGQKTVIDLDWI